MFKLTKLVTLRPDTSAAERKGVVDALRAAGKSDGRIQRAMLGPTMKGSFHGGDYIWHLQFAHEEDYRATVRRRSWRDTVDRLLESEPVSHVDGAAYRPGAGSVPDPGMKNGVYRTLLVTMRPGTPVGKIKQFEREMCEMPHYISAIRNWSFSEVTEACGTRAWTHVWEQDFHDVGALLGPYMMHPHHWAFIDRWYDHECPDWVVDTHICHTFCPFENSVFASLPLQ